MSLSRISQSRPTPEENDFDEVATAVFWNWIIREKIAQALRIDNDLETLKSLRLVGSQWPETVFKQWRIMSVCYEICLMRTTGMDQLNGFLKNSSQWPWIPVCFKANFEHLSDPAVLQFIEKYSDLVVSLSLSAGRESTFDLANNMTVLENVSFRNLRKLRITMCDYWNNTSSLDQWQAGLNKTSDLLTGWNCRELKEFHIHLELSWRQRRPNLTLPPALTNLSISTNALSMLEDERNVLPNLKFLELGAGDLDEDHGEFENAQLEHPELIPAEEWDEDGEVQVRDTDLWERRIQNVLQRHGPKLTKLICRDALLKTLLGVALPLSLERVRSLQEIHLGLPYCLVHVDSIEGGNFRTNLWKANIECTLRNDVQIRVQPNIIGEPVARLTSLGLALRSVPSVSLKVDCILFEPDHHFETLCTTYSFLSKLTWIGNEDILPHVFAHLTALKELDFQQPFRSEGDLTELLAGHSVDLIPEQEELWEGVLNQRTDVITNLTQLQTLTVKFGSFRPLSRFLFRAALSKMANLDKIVLRYTSTQEQTRAFLCSQVEEELVQWEQESRELLFQHLTG